jgi:hypothetical protein
MFYPDSQVDYPCERCIPDGIHDDVGKISYECGDPYRPEVRVDGRLVDVPLDDFSAARDYVAATCKESWNALNRAGDVAGQIAMVNAFLAEKIGRERSCGDSELFKLACELARAEAARLCGVK